jgi:hypothetical protein
MDVEAILPSSHPPSRPTTLRRNMPSQDFDIQREARKQPNHYPCMERFNEPVILFLTICTKDRKRIWK